MPKEISLGPSEQNPQRYKRARQKKKRKKKSRKGYTKGRKNCPHRKSNQAVRHPGQPSTPPLPHALLLLFFCSKDFISFFISTPVSIICSSSSFSSSTSLPLHHHVRDHSPHYQGYVTFSSRIVNRSFIGASSSSFFSSYPASSTSPIVTILSINGFSPTSIYATLL